MTADTYPKARVLLESESRIRLFCFPYAGSSAQIFHGWQQQLPRAIEVSPVHLPGRGKRIREKPFTDLVALAEVLVTELAPHVDKPYALFGHSLGAIIAFEVARGLRRKELPLPRRLFVSGCRAAQLSQDRFHSYDLPTEELIERLRKLNGTPPQILESPQLMEFFLPIIRADLQMIQTYQYSVDAPLHCPISAFGGWQDAEEPPEAIAAWREQTTASFQRQMFPGDHFFLHSETNLLLQAISRQLIDITSL